MIQIACRSARALAMATALITFAGSSLAADEGGASSTQAGEITELKRQLAEQQRQIEELRRMVVDQKKSTESAQGAATPATAVPAKSAGIGEVASIAPMLPPVPAAAKSAIPLPSPAPQKMEQEPSPLSFHIGNAYITPVGFMDMTGIFRSSTSGSGIGTNFGSIPYKNTVNGNLTEFRLSAQNSRVGARVDAIVKGAKVLGYWESDFLGFVPTNAAVSSNSDTFRLRLYWVDVKKNMWEVLGGQSWSMITPGRKGISPLPGDLFYSQDIDVNYQAGLTWGRIPQFRFVLHPTDKIAAGVSFEAAEQYIGGSGGGGLVTLPSALSTVYGTQLNNGGTTLGVPNVHPDIIAKVAFDPSSKFHFELGGLYRTFKVYNQAANRHFTASGAGIQANLNVELAKGFRFLTNNYWSDGGGRYLFGLAPDLIVRADGSLSPVHSGSTVSGFEYTHKNLALYAYYGGVLIRRNAAVDGAKLVGYGYSGSPSSQNKTIQEATFGFTETFWKDAKYGALAFMGQYSYLTRAPWILASGQPNSADQHMLFWNLRYTLPGSAPTLGK